MMKRAFLMATLLRYAVKGFITRSPRLQRGWISSVHAENPLPPEAVQSLLKGALSRAKRTIAEKDEASMEDLNEEIIASLFSISQRDRNLSNDPAITRVQVTNELLTSATHRAKRSLSTKADALKPSTSDDGSKKTPPQASNQDRNSTTEFIPTDLRYNQNPAISLTALAHWMWSSVLRPHVDAAIDATCGNGHDSVGIASILFSNEDLYLDRCSELVCIDIQAEACHATRQALSKRLPSSTVERNVQILQTSHSPLPVPRDTSSVGLVVYNLGYLPNSANKDAFLTQVKSTISSIADALLLIRVGGMVSVMTYPKTNKEEDFAVRVLLEAAVAMTNKQGPKWFAFVDQLGCSEEMKNMLSAELRRIATAYEQAGSGRTFRVTEHKKVGLPNAPILMTATRIK